MQIEPRTSPTDERFATGVSRRTLLRGAAVAGVVGVTGATVAACGGDDDGGATTGTGNGGGEAATGATLTASQVPLNGGIVVDANGAKVVVTQPSRGEFKAFSAICTHQRCTVNEIADNVIACPCHGSKFSAEDGSVQGGPAQAPLAGVNLNVSGENLTIG